MVPVLTALLALGLQTAPAATTSHDTGCPEPEPNATERVARVLSLPQVPDDVDVGTASASAVQTLSGEADRATCDSIRSAISSRRRQYGAEHRLSFLRSGDRYFVAITPPSPADRIRIGEHGVVEVYDDRFQLIDRISA